MWLELSERQSRCLRGCQEGHGQTTEGWVGCSEDFGFPVEGGGSHGRMLSRRGMHSTNILREEAVESRVQSDDLGSHPNSVLH